ncbi:MAG TPA: ABC transporter ATP-binding protein [Streptosporangiaceae bacterium]|nr:ABC transporter ATP-binding protein [Streptosporangiaceae bacterium]
MAERERRRPLGRLSRRLRRADILFGTPFRAAPLLATECVLAALGWSVLSLAYPVGFRAMVDGAAAHHPGRIVAGLIITAIAFPGWWVLRLISGALNAKLTDLGNLGLGARIGGLTSDAPFLEHYERPDYLAEIETLRERRRNLAGAPAQTLGMMSSAITFVGVAVLLALVWPPLIVVPLLAIAPALADRKAASVQKRSDDDLADRRRLLDQLFSLASTAAPARELRTFGATDGLLARHARLGDEINSGALRAARVGALWEASGWILYAAGFGAAIVALVLRAAHGAASPGAVVEVVSLLRRAQRQVSGASSTAGSFAIAATTADRLLWLEDYVASLKRGTGGPAPAELTDGIRFDHVGFTYPGQDTPVLHDICLTLRAGTTVAVVGENGAGKSTLIKLLTGMYHPTSGQITVDGRDLAGIDPERWRAATTGAYQDFVRFSMSLGDGVGAGDLPRIDDRAALLGAIRRAGAGDLVEAGNRSSGTPGDGTPGAGALYLDTLLGPYIGGRALSGGQWQRLALARGLMRERPLLVVLDEPTASLDAPSEAALFASYAEAALDSAGGTITVLVSHRFGTVHMAHQIIVLEDGRVAESGDHQALIERGGVYAELYALQAAGYR